MRASNAGETSWGRNVKLPSACTGLTLVSVFVQPAYLGFGVIKLHRVVNL